MGVEVEVEVEVADETSLVNGQGCQCDTVVPCPGNC